MVLIITGVFPGDSLIGTVGCIQPCLAQTELFVLIPKRAFLDGLLMQALMFFGSSLGCMLEKGVAFRIADKRCQRRIWVVHEVPPQIEGEVRLAVWCDDLLCF